jgi:hypothetical protein
VAARPGVDSEAEEEEDEEGEGLEDDAIKAVTTEEAEMKVRTGGGSTHEV